MPGADAPGGRRCQRGRAGLRSGHAGTKREHSLLRVPAGRPACLACGGRDLRPVPARGAGPPAAADGRPAGLHAAARSRDRDDAAGAAAIRGTTASRSASHGATSPTCSGLEDRSSTSLAASLRDHPGNHHAAVWRSHVLAAHHHATRCSAAPISSSISTNPWSGCPLATSRLLAAIRLRFAASSLPDCTTAM